MRYTYPHTITNGAGEELTFLRYVENESGGMLEVENKVKPGVGPPMHVHHLQDESLTVVQGLIAAHVAGEKPTFHGPGETVTFRRGVPHRFWNAGENVLICKGWITPAYNVEYFLTELFLSTQMNGGKRPSAFDGAFLQQRYRSEFDLVEVPSLVKTVVFPLIVMTGNLLGRSRKFKDAPEPVRGSS